MLSPHIISELTRPAPPEKTTEATVVRTGAVATALLAPGIALPLRDGHYGRQRDGVVVGPLRALDPGGLYAYVCDGQGWTAEGRYIANSDEPHPRDILRVLQQRP